MSGAARSGLVGLVLAAGLGVGVESARGQSFNIDCGTYVEDPVDPYGLPPPDAGFGAVSGQTGVWQKYPGGSAAFPLVDLNGNPTNVNITLSVGIGSGIYNASPLTGNERSLFADYLTWRHTSVQMRFNNLQTGHYLFTVYAWPPDVDWFRTTLNLVDPYYGFGYLEPGYEVGGAYPDGGYAEGVTHAVIPYTVFPGRRTTLLAHYLGNGTINGIQVQRFSLADIDKSGAVEVADIFAYLAQWFNEFENGVNRTGYAIEMDGDRIITVADIFAFLNVWFQDFGT